MTQSTFPQEFAVIFIFIQDELYNTTIISFSKDKKIV